MARKSAPPSAAGSRSSVSSLSPLLLEPSTVLFEEAEVSLAAEPAEGRHLPVVHEGVAGAAGVVASVAHAAVVVAVLEHPGAEALVEETDLFEDLAPHRDAEERERRDRERLAVVRPGPL